MDLTTFNQLTATYQAMAYDLACRILGNPHEAAHVVEASVAELYRSGRHLDIDHFRCRWLAGVVHACVESIRTHPPAGSHAHAMIDWAEILENAGASPTPLLPLCEAVEAGLHILGVEERIVLLLHDRYDLSESETATVTGLSPDGVRKCLIRGRIGLRNYLAEHSNFPPVAVRFRSQ